MGEAKRKRDRYRKAIENNERWVLLPGVNGNLCSGSFEYLSDMIANQYAELEVYETVYQDMDVEQIREVEENPEEYREIIEEVERVKNESFNRLKNSIREHCTKYGKYQFNFVIDEDEDEVVDYEELAYRPELDPLEKLP